MKTYQRIGNSYTVSAVQWHKPGDSDHVGEGWSYGDLCDFLPYPEHLKTKRGLKFHPVMLNTSMGVVIEVGSGDWICHNKVLNTWYSMTDEVFKMLFIEASPSGFCALKEAKA